MKALSLRPPVLFCLCILTALALVLSALQAATASAADLSVTGGQGEGAVTGGQGGYVKSGAAWAAAGGGGGGGNDPGTGNEGHSGDSGSATGGGAGGGPDTGIPGINGGAGGAAVVSTGASVSGGANSGSLGGSGGSWSGDLNGMSVSVGGGKGGNSYTGGDGGNASVEISTSGSYSTIAVTGGKGDVSVGGKGGTANLKAQVGTRLTVDTALNVTSGTTTHSGQGGAASFTADTLSAPTINLTKQDGALNFNVTTLDVTGGNTALTLNNTTAANVVVGTVNLGGGNNFTVAGTGAGAFTNLDVTGAGGTLTAPAAQLFSNVSLAGGSTFVSTNSLNFNKMRVLGQGASYTGTLNAVGKTLTFDLPASLTPGQTMLNVAGNADISGSTVNLTYQTVRPTVQPGESLTLLAATNLTADQTGLTVQTTSGDIYTLQVDNNQLLAMLQQISPNTPAYERLKAFAEGRTATLAFVNQGQDLILNQGMGSALMATGGPGFQLNAFAAGQGGWSRYNTGSHVDVSGASMLAGMALGNDLGYGRLTLGAFFEGGWGGYNSHNSFSNYAKVKGDGDTDYYGGGILGRWDIPCGAYIDASARMGRARTDFNTDDIKYNGGNADFDSSAMYYGAHAGLGYQWSFSEQAMLDLSARFLWIRQASDSVDVHGDRVHFDDADSLRTRLGGRFNYAVTEKITPYAGAYWEHEFDGRQCSNVNGVGIGSPSLKGDTGVGELGVSVRPVADSGFSMDLGVQGYTGVREGVSGSLQVKYAF